MIVRLSKALLVLMVGLFSLLVGADNIVDYGTNYAFVEHVMAMDTIFPNSTLTWRSITSDRLNEIAYALIIAGE
jgi:predicted small integral membrane protein